MQGLIVLLILSFTNVMAIDFCEKMGFKSFLCTRINSCPTLSAQISRLRTTKEKFRKLQTLACGFEKNQPKVCCQQTKFKPSFHSVADTKKSTKEILPSIKECGKTMDSSDYILGGRSAHSTSFPWVVRIGYKGLGESDYEYICGGTLISRNYVLSAAHCILSLHYDRYNIRLGDENTKLYESHEQNARVKNIIMHEDYDTSSKHGDIALIELSANVDCTEHVRPVCLPYVERYYLKKFPEIGADQYRLDITAEVAGFGKTANGEENTDSETLQVVELPLVSNPDCEKIYEGKATINSKQLCAGGVRGQDSCTGDSGGGLFLKDEITKRIFQIGIVSYGPKLCGTSGSPGVYTRISSYLDWILETMQQSTK